MHIHILGICGTFMGSVALLAQKLGHKVTGSDTAIYPPMSDELKKAGIKIKEGYLAHHLDPAPDLVVVGNACKRGMEAVEYMLNQNLPYTSGPQFLADFVLKDKHVIGIAGTHGKTTTTTMTTWILDFAGIDTGYLIGGVPLCFEQSARLGSAPYFVVEADEYDSAFFDKRSKFIHYRPRTAVLNNLEFDHADIFEDLAAIQKQFHHLVRTIASQGLIVMPNASPELETVLNMGCYTPVLKTAITNNVKMTDNNVLTAVVTEGDDGKFLLYLDGQQKGCVHWQMTGTHNIVNALSAIAAAYHIGVSIKKACQALSVFKGIKRRMELLSDYGDILVYDDFAHHPTAIKTTLQGAKNRLAGRKIFAVIEPRSNTMKMGVHAKKLADATQDADTVIWYEKDQSLWLDPVIKASQTPAHIMSDIDEIVAYLVDQTQSGDVIILMSNGDFGGIYEKLVQSLNPNSLRLSNGGLAKTTKHPNCLQINTTSLRFLTGTGGR